MLTAAGPRPSPGMPAAARETAYEAERNVRLALQIYQQTGPGPAARWFRRRQRQNAVS